MSSLYKNVIYSDINLRPQVILHWDNSETVSADKVILTNLEVIMQVLQNLFCIPPYGIPFNELGLDFAKYLGREINEDVAFELYVAVKNVLDADERLSKIVRINEVIGEPDNRRFRIVWEFMVKGFEENNIIKTSYLTIE